MEQGKAGASEGFGGSAVDAVLMSEACGATDSTDPGSAPEQVVDAPVGCRPEDRQAPVLLNASRVFNQQNGDVTRAYYEQMNRRGPLGQVAVALFRAQK